MRLHVGCTVTAICYQELVEFNQLDHHLHFKGFQKYEYEVPKVRPARGFGRWKDVSENDLRYKQISHGLFPVCL